MVQVLFLVLLLGAQTGAGATHAVPIAPVIDAYPHPSPDGRRIVFQSDRDGIPQVYVADTDGRHLRRLTHHPLGCRTPKWSPDGERIVYAIGTDATSDIWVMDADGSNAHPLVATPGDDSHPQWSPDGRRIVFNTSRPAGEGSGSWDDIHVVDADGTHMRRLTDCRGTCTYPSLSPDGKHMVFRRVERHVGRGWSQQPVDADSEIVVADDDGRHARPLAPDAAFDGWPAWSPDGRWIAFASGRDGVAYAAQVYLVHPDGSGLHAITGGPWSHVQPAWSRDGRALFVYRSQETADSEFGMVARVALPPGD